MLAKRFGWTKQQIDEQDETYIDDLLVFTKAEADHNALLKRKPRKNQGAG